MYPKTKSLLTLFLILFFVSVITSSCDENDELPVILGYTNIYIRPNSTEYLQLNTVGGWAYLNGSTLSRGILVYRVTTDEFMAYERTPTYKPDSCCTYVPVEICAKVVVDESGIIVKDTCAGTRYLILDGSVVDGPARYALLQYRTSYDGDILHIYN